MSAIRPRGRLLRISRGGMALPAAPEGGVDDFDGGDRYGGV